MKRRDGTIHDLPVGAGVIMRIIVQRDKRRKRNSLFEWRSGGNVVCDFAFMMRRYFVWMARTLLLYQVRAFQRTQRSCLSIPYSIVSVC